MNLTVSPSDIMLVNNQLYLSQAFAEQYLQAMITMLMVGMIGGLGIALLMNDVIKPWLIHKFESHRYEPDLNEPWNRSGEEVNHGTSSKSGEAPQESTEV